MTTNDYVKNLEKKLYVLNKKTKDNILKEIQVHIKEQNLSYESLVEKFGDVEDLASSYLEDNIQETIQKKWYKKKRTYFLLFLFLIFAFFIYIYFQVKDPFNYSLYDEKTIENKVALKWSKLSNIKEINSNQSHLVIYASSKDYLQYACRENNILSKDKNNILNIKQKFCFIKLPKEVQNIKAFQSKIVLIKAQTNLFLDFEQSELNIAENGSFYFYDINQKQSDYQDLESKESKINIKIRLLQSQAKYYKY